MVVIHRIMLCTPIIPERNTPHIPAKPARKLRLDLVREQEPQQRRRLIFRPALETGRVRRVHVQCFPPCLWMCPYDGVDRLIVRFGVGISAVANTVFAGFTYIGFRRGIHGLEAG